MIVVVSDGSVSIIANHDTQASAVQSLSAALGSVQRVRRGGHVVPADRIRRSVFRLLRRLLGSGGRVAAWTRTWPGPWLVKMASGDVLGPFADRDVAVEAEIEHLLARGGGK